MEERELVNNEQSMEMDPMSDESDGPIERKRSHKGSIVSKGSEREIRLAQSMGSDRSGSVRRISG